MTTPNAKLPLHVANGRLNRVETALGKCFLQSMPRYMTIVLGNGCNIDCPHCYQIMNGDNLLRTKGVGAQLRREFLAHYPYLETLRLQGGEVFALKGFEALIEDVASVARRPLISVSSNGTLINEEWANRIVETPWQTLTISFDAGTPETFERLRRGAKFDRVIENVSRIQKIRRERASWYPNLDAFFVVMRSNFREIPQFLDLMEQIEIYEVSFQTLLVDERNLAREPGLIGEQISEPDEIAELHELLVDVIARRAPAFDRIAWSGFTSLFARCGLDSSFLEERRNSLFTDGDKSLRRTRRLSPPVEDKYGEAVVFPAGVEERRQRDGFCPNPWSTLFVTENGDISLCFLSAPVGNLYDMPLAEIWNSPAAIAKRGRMLAGRYTASGCSPLWCSWRDGKRCEPQSPAEWTELRRLFEQQVGDLGAGTPLPHGDGASTIPDTLRAVRRLLMQRNERIHELEANLAQLWDDNGHLHEAGQRHITYLETMVAQLQQELAGLRGS